MKERPILFSAPMVRAILDGRKTQTRRIIKNIGIAPGIGYVLKGSDDADEWSQFCPCGKPGDRLWVRETNALMDSRHCSCYEHCGQCVIGKYAYKADQRFDDFIAQWKPSIHMPRIASRILLKITDVRVERLQDISDEDAIAEGVDGENEAAKIGAEWYEKPKRAYRRLWKSINGHGSWDLNPWVWVVEFKLLEVKQ